MLAYRKLLTDAAPSAIDSDAEYDAVKDRLSELVGKSSRRTEAEAKLMRLLGLIVQDYDRRHALPPDDSSPAERLQFLMDESGRPPKDLLPVFGTRSHVWEALNGKREISAKQSRELGKLFGLRAGYFV